MIHTIKIYEATGVDPYENLAAEQFLLEQLQPGLCILYLWQNQDTVVIGKNQNAWAECRVSLLEQEGGKVARRLSGGGAVFHDLGNLNFTFLVGDENYDVDKQLSVIAQACKMAGISVEKSGRNDLLTDGRKFSGNAFYHSQGNSYHHGTLLIASEMDKLQRYLSPSKAKLEAKGVSSVRSRVVNLTEIAPELTIDAMKENMARSFENIYGLKAEPVILSQDDQQKIAALAEKNRSWEHLFGTPLPFTFQCEQRFPWGGIQLDIAAKGGIIQAVKVYSDAMDWQLPGMIEAALTSCRFDKAAICSRLQATITDPLICTDLCAMIENQDI